MKSLPVLWFLLILSILLAGCNLPVVQPGQVTDAVQLATPTSAQQPPPSETPALQATQTLPPEEPTPSTGSITEELLRNFTYSLDGGATQVALANGIYDAGDIHAELVDPAALGDLNGDGLADAAVILRVNTGGSGTFYYLVPVVDQNGSPVQAGEEFIGDRQVINSLQIEQGRIVLDYLTQGLSDALCCPSERRLRSYLLEGRLYLASEQVLTSPEEQAEPLPNAILIDQPGQNEVLTYPLMVSGRVSQAPPDMTLEYYVTDMSATLLASGDVALEGTPGGVAAFSFEIALDPQPAGVIQVELVDAADGMLLGRSVVALISQP